MVRRLINTRAQILTSSRILANNSHLSLSHGQEEIAVVKAVQIPTSGALLPNLPTPRDIAPPHHIPLVHGKREVKEGR